jgi:hypothetical protein
MMMINIPQTHAGPNFTQILGKTQTPAPVLAGSATAGTRQGADNSHARAASLHDEGSTRACLCRPQPGKGSRNLRDLMNTLDFLDIFRTVG